MLALLLLLSAVVTLIGATYEVALLTTSRERLAEAVSRRLRGDDAPLAWPRAVGRELVAAATFTVVGVAMIGAVLPAFFSGRPFWELVLGVLLLAVPLAMVSGYVLPRWIGRTRADGVVGWLRPLVAPVAAVLRLVMPRGGLADEVRALGREEAALLPGADPQLAMVGGALTFASRPVREVMVPRTDLVAVPEGGEVADVIRIFAESGYSRIPVYRETLDDIVGMLHAFDLFRLRPAEPLPVRPVTLAPASRACADLLLDMQRERRHLAVVIDEFGGTLGIVTLEDLLTALVGEIYDEDAAPVPGGEAVALLEIEGSAPVEELESHFGLELPPGHATTVGGRLAELAGRIPMTGERLAVRGLEFDILEASPSRVERLVVRRAVPVTLSLPRSDP